MEKFRSRSVDQTISLGRDLAARLKRGDCVALIGPLGAGKTILARGIALGMGLEDERLVSSPTFVLVQEYPARLPVYHVDLYRLADPAVEFASLGIEEMLADGVVVIEWAERAGDALPSPRWEVVIAPAGETIRDLTLRRVD